MAHAVQTIVDAAVAALSANTALQANVYSHRTVTLSQDEMEAPAVSVTIEDDSPFSELGASNTTFIDSLLTLRITVVATDSGESDLMADLLELRRQVHVAMMASNGRSLGLSFVYGVRYAGADAPVINVDGQNIAGSIATRWGVPYRTIVTDPA